MSRCNRKKCEMEKVMSIVFGIIAALCMVYYIIAASYAGPGSSFLSFWLVAVAGFGMLALFFHMAGKGEWLSHIPVIIKAVATFIFIFAVVVFCVIEGMIISKINATPEKDVDYLIVLGAQVRGTKVTKSLARRLDVAYEYADKHEEVTVIVSGGQGRGEDLSEAEAMKKYLVKKGLDENRIIMEDKSTTTKENLMFSDEKADLKDKRIAIVTNNFHVYRAMKLAEKLGYKKVEGLAGKSDKILFINYMVRESFAILKEYAVGNI